MSSLKIIIENLEDTQKPNQADMTDEQSPLPKVKCDHCGGDTDNMGPPLTCGCTVCDCMCPKWHICPKE